MKKSEIAPGQRDLVSSFFCNVCRFGDGRWVNQPVLSVWAILTMERKQIYMITYPTGKIYIGKDVYGSSRYFGSPQPDLINADFDELPDEIRKDYTIRKQILWESEDCDEMELSRMEVKFIRQYKSNDPKIGYNRWPKHNKDA